MGRQRLPDDLTARRAGFVIGAITLGVSVAAGILMRSVDHKDFPTIGSGLWWAVQTVTTVGYGDVTPERTIGRFVGAIVMVVAIAFSAVITALITSAFVQGARQRIDAPTEQRNFNELVERLDRIEEALRRLSEQPQAAPQDR